MVFFDLIELTHSGARTASGPRPDYGPALEQLEDRVVLSNSAGIAALREVLTLTHTTNKYIKVLNVADQAANQKIVQESGLTLAQLQSAAATGAGLASNFGASLQDVPGLSDIPALKDLTVDRIAEAQVSVLALRSLLDTFQSRETSRSQAFMNVDTAANREHSAFREAAQQFHQAESRLNAEIKHFSAELDQVDSVLDNLRTILGNSSSSTGSSSGGSNSASGSSSMAGWGSDSSMGSSCSNGSMGSGWNNSSMGSGSGSNGSSSS
jgi:hypothetical protein